LENRRGEDDEMFRRVWKAVEAEVEEVRIAEVRIAEVKIKRK